MKKAPVNPKRLKPHPLGALFPPMNDADYAQLKTSLKKNGFDPAHPIVCFEGMILEGNHRYSACKATRTTPIFKEYKGDDPIGFVIQENMARRNLTPSQAATLGADLAEKIKEAHKQAAAELRAAQAASKKTSGHKGAKTPSKRPKGSTAGKAAKAVGVSERSVAAAAALKKEDPAAFEEVKKGRKSLNSAAAGAGKKSDAFAEAVAVIAKAVDQEFADAITESHSAKEVIKLSGIDAAEIKRIRPFLEAKWNVKDALSYKSVALVPGHKIRELFCRAIDKNGTYVVKMPSFGKKWKITVEEDNEGEQ